MQDSFLSVNYSTPYVETASRHEGVPELSPLRVGMQHASICVRTTIVRPTEAAALRAPSVLVQLALLV